MSQFLVSEEFSDRVFLKLIWFEVTPEPSVHALERYAQPLGEFYLGEFMLKPIGVELVNKIVWYVELRSAYNTF